jgi:hypothetical protein
MKIAAHTILPLLVCATTLPVHAQQMLHAELIECTGPFAKTSSHDQPIDVFGAANVVFQDIGGPEGETRLGSIVFPEEPQRRFAVVWKDDAGRRNPKEIYFREGSAWRTSNGLRIGGGLAEVQQLNGKPFSMRGFEWDYGGYVRSWQGGALERFNTDCHLGMRFEPSDDRLAGALSRVLGERSLLSNDPDVRAVRPKISEIFLKYP